MVKIRLIFAALLLPAYVQSQTDSIVVPESQTLDLQVLVAEALMNNPEIRATLFRMDATEAKALQAGYLEPPELSLMQEAMPDFRFNEAMYTRLELTQTMPFPSKLGVAKELARIEDEHAHHDHLERANDIVARLKTGYYELWLLQQNIVLEQENARLMKQFHKVARARYGVGSVPQQDVLKAQVELSTISNSLVSLRQRELSTKSMLMSILNRAQKDTLGFAAIPEEVVFTSSLDRLLILAREGRPMLLHDSLSIVEARTTLTSAKQEYLPDFIFGLERITTPVNGFQGWSVRAGITLPFAPWTLGKAAAGVDEASALINRSSALYAASLAMVTASIKDLFYKAQAAKRRLEIYRTEILPQTEQSVKVSLAAYETGQANFLMLIDAYRTNVNLTKEYYMTRMELDQTIADLERQVGYQNITSVK